MEGLEFEQENYNETHEFVQFRVFNLVYWTRIQVVCQSTAQVSFIVSFYQILVKQKFKEPVDLLKSTFSPFVTQFCNSISIVRL